MNKILILSAVLMVSACSTTKNSVKAVGDNKYVEGVTTAPQAKDVNSVTDDATFGEAVLSPLQDINVRKVEIPELLLAMDTPYGQIPDRTCDGLFSEIVELNTVLGPDMDAPDYESKKSKKSKKRKAASLDLVGYAAGSFIPFRGLVRKATGASKYDKELRAQYRKGVARRSYLRGIFDADEC